MAAPLHRAGARLEMVRWSELCCGHGAFGRGRWCGAVGCLSSWLQRGRLQVCIRGAMGALWQVFFQAVAERGQWVVV